MSFAHTSKTWPILRQARNWGISLLAEGMESVSQDLRRPTDERFSGLKAETVDGAVLLQGVLVRIRVAPRSEVEAGDHTLKLLDVLDLERDDTRDPLVFYGSRVRTLAPG